VSLRFKLVLAIVALTAASTVTIGVLSYAGIAHRLESEVDRSLDDAARQVASPDPDGDRPGFNNNDHSETPQRQPDNRPPSFEQILVQYLDRGGAVVAAPAGLDLPVDDHDQAVAVGTLAEYRREVDTDSGEYQVLTTSLGSQGAVQVARSLGETNRLLSSLRTLTIVITLAVIAAAAVVGWLIARQITRRLRQLTSAAESVAETGALDIEVPVDGTDEAGRLGASFSKMLNALATSRDAQQRLVQDAGHELRTPLTSLRTNVSVLRRHDDLPPQTAAHVLDQIDDEAHELTDLVNELVELATDRRDQEPATDVDLGDAVRRAVSRARRRTERDIRAVTDHSRVLAQPSSIDRALSNLIDNATKFAPDGPIDVSVRAGRVEVADRGPGIDPADIDHVFDRFFRATSARNRPGSGLGLSIVRDAAEGHGGQVFAEPRDGGGTVIGFALPVIAPGADDGIAPIPT
jgi:two-component system, OmpR family, sensor histidine kinase MprB